MRPVLVDDLVLVGFQGPIQGVVRGRGGPLGPIRGIDLRGKRPLGPVRGIVIVAEGDARGAAAIVVGKSVSARLS